MADIFISFIHEEGEIAEALQAFINESYQSQKVFLSSDQWQVFAGEDWLQRIRDELKSARVVILLLSKRSVVRPWVNFEAGAAWLTDKKIIPACIGDLDKGDLQKPYSNLQALNLPADAYFLLTSIAHHLTLISPPPGYIEEKSSWLGILQRKIEATSPAV